MLEGDGPHTTTGQNSLHTHSPPTHQINLLILQKLFIYNYVIIYNACILLKWTNKIKNTTTTPVTETGTGMLYRISAKFMLVGKRSETL
jgi:hypothetical protein